MALYSHFYTNFLSPNVSGEALKNYEVKEENGDVTIGRTQVKLADGQHVYDGKSARYTQSPITLVYTDDNGEEQVLDYTFELSDLQFFFNQQPTSAIHVHDGGYLVVLSEKGKETSETREETRSTRVFGISANTFTLPLIYVIR